MPPRVSAAVLRTFWNGWCTKRRFQQRGPCLLGCTSFSAEDSIEHYECCPVTLDFAHRILGLEMHTCHNRAVYGRRRIPLPGVAGRAHVGKLTALGLNLAPATDDLLILRALWCYAVYRTTNEIRQCPCATPEVAGDLLRQFAHEGARNHCRSMRALASAHLVPRSREDRSRSPRQGSQSVSTSSNSAHHGAQGAGAGHSVENLLCRTVWDDDYT